MAHENTNIVREQGGNTLVVKSGGTLQLDAGSTLTSDGTTLRIKRGVHTTVAASDTVVTGLATVVAVVVSLASDPTDDPFLVTATVGDQAGTPAAGSILIKTWQHDGTDPTPAAADTFSKLVNWIAIGT